MHAHNVSILNEQCFKNRELSGIGFSSMYYSTTSWVPTSEKKTHSNAMSFFPLSINDVSNQNKLNFKLDDSAKTKIEL